MLRTRTCFIVFIRLSWKNSGPERGKRWQRIFKPVDINITEKNIVTQLQYLKNHSGLHFGHPLKALCAEVAFIEADVTWS